MFSSNHLYVTVLLPHLRPHFGYFHNSCHIVSLQLACWCIVGQEKIYVSQLNITVSIDFVWIN